MNLVLTNLVNTSKSCYNEYCTYICTNLVTIKNALTFIFRGTLIYLGKLVGTFLHKTNLVLCTKF
jgi:hypothetical protein